MEDILDSKFEDAATLRKKVEKPFSDHGVHLLGAIHSGVARASKTLEGIPGAWIKEQKVIVTGGKVTEFRVNMSVTFLLKD